MGELNGIITWHQFGLVVLGQHVMGVGDCEVKPILISSPVLQCAEFNLIDYVGRWGTTTQIIEIIVLSNGIIAWQQAGLIVKGFLSHGSLRL